MLSATSLVLTASPSALYLLYIQYAAPFGTFDEETFATVKAAEETETETTFNWPKIGYIFVFQVRVITCKPCSYPLCILTLGTIDV